MPATKNTPKVAPEFERTRAYIRRYVVMNDAELDIVTTWAMHTHLFSPSCEIPKTTPYLYITAPKGAAKTLLGQDVLSTIVRAPMNTVGLTGPGLIRLVGGMADDDDDGDSGPGVPTMPTLSIDEVDALYSGSKDEALRMMLNAGYRVGGVVPRVVGKQVVNYSAFCPKILMGIDNGHLPDTVTDRSIRIDLNVATPEEMQTVEPFYSYEIEDEAAELMQELATWAQRNSLGIRDYKPTPDEAIAKRPRHWEISRTLVQVAKFAGVEDRVIAALRDIFSRHGEATPVGVRMLSVIRDLFNSGGENWNNEPTDRLSNQEILSALRTASVEVPGMNGKGLAVKLAEFGIKPPNSVRLPEGHPDRGTGGSARGIYRYLFTDAFARHLPPEDADDDNGAA